MSNPAKSPGLMDNLKGALDVMLGRESGMKRIDLSGDGFWWSFAGLGLTALIDASALSMSYGTRGIAELANAPGKPYFVFGNLTIAMIGYAASMVALYLLCQTPSEQKRFSSAVILHNWASPIVSVAFFPLIFIFAGASAGVDAAGSGMLMTMLFVFSIGVLVAIGTRLIKISLDLPFSKAILFFAVTTAVSLLSTEGLQILAGLSTGP